MDRTRNSTVFLTEKGWTWRGYDAWTNAKLRSICDTKEALMYQRIWDQGVRARQDYVSNFSSPYSLLEDTLEELEDRWQERTNRRGAKLYGSTYKAKNPEPKQESHTKKIGEAMWLLIKLPFRILGKIKW